MKDPYYRKILEGLKGPLDPTTFEACADALLRETYPTLVPVHGGQDYGMDGAIADGDGEAYPLIVTTAKDVIGNLSRNLDSYIAGGGRRHRAVVATSTELTATRRKNLQERAKEKGFTLVQIHDRRDIADRLYRDSRWAKELLGITPEPAALSAVPRTRRPLREDVPLIGREADLAWLRETSGDRVIIGQPGAGKTYLLLHLVREGKALFLASENEGLIAADLRDLRPEIVIVDDAHLEPERMVRLRELREEIEADFDIIATGWRGTEDDLADALALPPSENVRRLELLTPKQILEVLRGIGIQDPDDDPWLRALVDQAANKPGLAVTLGSLWLRGEWLDVLTGKAIKRSLVPALKRVLESDPTELLACFALGGDCGMTMEAVRRFLDVDRAQLRHQVVHASHGGVLEALGDDRLAVQPEILRPALLNEVFFTPPCFDYRDLFARVVDEEDAVETLVQAAQLGAPIGVSELRSLVGRVTSRRAWQRLAATDEGNARWVLEHYSGNVEDIIHPVLDTAPSAAIQRLLQDARSAEGPLHSSPEHPLRILQDWLQEPRFVPGGGGAVYPQELLSRRALVVREAKKSLDSGGDPVVGLRACLLALSPRVESSHETVSGGSIRIRSGVLPAKFVPEILSLWSEVRGLIVELTRETWTELEDLLQHWVYPETLTLGRPLPDETVTEMRRVPQQILQDIQGLADERPGLQWALLKWAERLEISLDLEVDEEFGILFPLQEHITSENWQQEEAALDEAARRYAAACSSRPPEEMVERLAFYQREAETFSHTMMEVPHAFYRALAQTVGRPEEWLASLLDHKIDAGYVGYFLMRVVREKRPGWRTFLGDSLESHEYERLAATEIIRSEGIDEELLQRALDRVPAHHVEAACQRKEVPLPNLRELLRHPNEEIALAAAVGEWLSDPEKGVRDELWLQWKEAILRYGTKTEVDRFSHRGTGYWLKAIFIWSPALALEWLLARIRDAGELEIATEHGLYHAAVRALGMEQRRQLLMDLEPSHLARQLIPWLVGDSPDLYKHLLAREDLRDSHLEPLSQESLGDKWKELAPLAVDAGHGARAVAEAITFPAFSGWGHGGDRWSKWKATFEDILATGGGPLREIAVHGLNISSERLEEAQAERRHFELTGRF